MSSVQAHALKKATWLNAIRPSVQGLQISTLSYSLPHELDRYQPVDFTGSEIDPIVHHSTVCACFIVSSQSSSEKRRMLFWNKRDRHDF